VGGIRFRAQFEPLKADRQQGESLIEIIVEFSSNSATLLLLGVDQPTGHFNH